MQNLLKFSLIGIFAFSLLVSGTIFSVFAADPRSPIECPDNYHGIPLTSSDYADKPKYQDCGYVDESTGYEYMLFLRWNAENGGISNQHGYEMCSGEYEGRGDVFYDKNFEGRLSVLNGLAPEDENALMKWGIINILPQLQGVAKECPATITESTTVPSPASESEVIESGVCPTNRVTLQETVLEESADLIKIKCIYTIGIIITEYIPKSSNAVCPNFEEHKNTFDKSFSTLDRTYSEDGDAVWVTYPDGTNLETSAVGGIVAELMGYVESNELAKYCHELFVEKYWLDPYEVSNPESEDYNPLSKLYDPLLDFTSKDFQSATNQQIGQAKMVADDVVNKIEEESGCLIATASYGSELSPQVQMLREIRDNSLLQTESGFAFMTQFNTYYYTFAPTVAQWENDSPIFKEIVKTTITPLISSLSLLQYVDMKSESEVLFYGISMIVLNLGMYIGIPIVAIVGIRKKF